MSSKYKTIITDGDDNEIKIVVSYTAHKFRRGARDCGRYLQIEPDEPAHIEIDGIETIGDIPVEFTKELERDLVDEISAYLADMESAAMEDRIDARRESRLLGD
jgi:hypothetical protein